MRRMIIKEIKDKFLYGIPNDIIDDNMDTPIKYIKDVDLDWMNALDKIQHIEEKYDIEINIPGNDYLGCSINQLADYIISSMNDISNIGCLI